MKQEIETLAFSFQDGVPCAYFDDGRTAALEYLFAGEKEAMLFHKFLAKGYRRMGSIFYRNVCKGCSSCRPIRIETDRFEPSRSQKKTLKKNSEMRLEISSPSVTRGKFELYRKYLFSKHSAKRADEDRGYETLRSLHYGYPHTMEMDYYLGGELIGVGIVDGGENFLSSNYFYYDTDYLDRRLGVFSIVSEISLARRMRKKYYYLGFYIEKNPKMSYKKDFRPNQVYEDGEWKDFVG